MKIRVRIIEALTIREILHPPGMIIRIPLKALPQLAGKVEQLDPIHELELPTKIPERARTLLPQMSDLPSIGRQANGTCYICKGQDWWRGRSKQVCRACHPPAPGAEV